MLDKLLGTALTLEAKTIAVTGASGTMGRSLIQALLHEGAQPVALTTSGNATFADAVRVQTWQPGHEADLQTTLAEVDILIINHGVNVHGARTPEAIAQSLQVNALSAIALMDAFLATSDATAPARVREIWVNTSEAEVGPAFSPLYEISKRLIGDLITLKRREAPCVIRKIVLGPFKSNLNPIGILPPQWVANTVIALAKRDIRNIIVTVNPFTYLAFPLKEMAQSIYFSLFSKSE